MRNLTHDEIEFLDDNGESEEDGIVAIESTIRELTAAGVGTGCGRTGNRCFSHLTIFGDRRCRGWYDEPVKEVTGMFHIEVTEAEAEDISKLAGEVGGSLRSSGKSLWNGFMEFEIE